MNRSALFLPSAGALLVGFAAAGCTTAPAPSTLSGTLEQASFPAPVANVTLLKSDGTLHVAAVNAVGRFTIALDAGATYQVFLGRDGQSVPLAVRSAALPYGSRFTVTSDGATGDLGTIRFHDGSIQPRELVLAQGVAPITNLCSAGVLGATGIPCTTSDATIACSESSGHMQGGCPNMGGHGGHGGPDMQDASAAPDTSATPIDDSLDAIDTSGAFAVAGENLVASIGCAGDEGHHDEPDGDRH
jgi:hypothetical protein